MFIFGPGVLIATIPGGTPVNIGLAQEITYSEKATNKSLFGQNRRALAVGGGTIKSTVKIKMARISGLAIAQTLLGLSPTAGGTFAVVGESHTLPASAPTLTMTPPNGGTFLADQGIVYSATGLPLTYTTASPSTGQYSVNTTTGVYAFAAGDDSAGVYANYTYNTGSLGQSFLSGNPILGNTISMSAMIQYVDPTTNLTAALLIYNMVLDGIDLATKLEDFTYPELNGECFVNAAGNAYKWSIPDKF